MFSIGLTILSDFKNANSLSCISMNKNVKQDPMLLMLMEMNLCFFPFSIETTKCSGSGNSINYPHATICVSDVVKNLNVKVFNLMSRTNETRYIEQDENCKCECKFGANICNNKQCWNKDKCRCECKQLIDKGVCNEGFIWNPSNCECECDKACDFGEYLVVLA